MHGVIGKASHLFRKYFVLRPQFNVLVLWIGVHVLSITACYVHVPKTYFSDKRNLLNVYFVKWGWLWTLVTLGPYIGITAFVYGVENWKTSVLRAALRLAVATLVWYFWVNIAFPFVENSTGVCVVDASPDLEVLNRTQCVRRRRSSHAVEWKSFDISGHCFLLSYSILVIASELQVHRNWDKIPTHAACLIPIGSRGLGLAKQRYARTLPLVRQLFAACCVVSVLWHVALVFTCLYFHTLLDKSLGTSFAVLSWMLTYNEVWAKRPRWAPGAGPLCLLLSGIDTSRKDR